MADVIWTLKQVLLLVAVSVVAILFGYGVKAAWHDYGDEAYECVEWRKK